MTSSNILEFPDPLRYLLDTDQKINGVAWIRGKEEISLFLDGTINITGKDHIVLPRKDLSDLMVMWLALNYPETLKFDDEE